LPSLDAARAEICFGTVVKLPVIDDLVSIPLMVWLKLKRIRWHRRAAIITIKE
jgi:hypothetical protein